ncbi:MAG: patatin-like phospholipase family protein [Desulfobacterales bacterium]|nr:patatin-like phospholipase family protein [Desulfobacterales bacterium]
MTMEAEKQAKKIGLALGGGAILGAAHIGVLGALEERNIKISSISGTSIGAFIAALYAFGVSPQEIETKVADLNWLDAAGFSISKYGLLSNEKLGEALKDTLGDVQFKDAKIPLAVVATDIGACKKVILKEGNVAEAVMASACIPGIFIPVEINGRLLVDGGLIENVPISPLKEMGEEMILGVDLNAKRKYQKPEDIIDVLANALDLAIDNATRLQTQEADILIAPELSAYNRADVEKIHDLIKEGYDAAQAILNEL